MHGLVKIKGLNALYFLEELPEDREELDLVVEGGGVSVPPDIVDWPEGADQPMRVLGVSRSDPRRYRLFRSPGEVGPAGFDPTSLNYGGIYTPRMWQLLAKGIPDMRAFEATPADPPGAWEEAMRYIREGC